MLCTKHAVCSTYVKLKVNPFLTKYYSGDQIKKTELVTPYSTYRGEKRRIECFDGET
jgi:hypothetical protein